MKVHLSFYIQSFFSKLWTYRTELFAWTWMFVAFMWCHNIRKRIYFNGAIWSVPVFELLLPHQALRVTAVYGNDTQRRTIGNKLKVQSQVTNGQTRLIWALVNYVTPSLQKTLLQKRWLFGVKLRELLISCGFLDFCFMWIGPI